MSILKLSLLLSVSAHVVAFPLYISHKRNTQQQEAHSFQVRLISIDDTMTRTKHTAGNAGEAVRSSAASQAQLSHQETIDEPTTPTTRTIDNDSFEQTPSVLTSATTASSALKHTPRTQKQSKRNAQQQRSLTTIEQFKAGQHNGGATPLYDQNPPPIYPRTARLKNWQGTVIIGADINVSGGVMRTWVHTSSGYELLDNAAQKAVQKWHFQPARLYQHAIESTVQVPVEFALNTEDEP